MTALHPRVKMVSFRLSDEEYRQAVQTCLEQGFRSVSALAYAATVRAIEESSPAPEPSAAAYPHFEARLDALAQALSRVTALLDINVSAAAASK